MRTLLQTLVLIISTSLLGTAQASSTPQTKTSPPVGKPASTEPTAIIHTTAGDLHCTLFPKIAPIGVENFIGLAAGTKDWTSPTSHAKKHGVALYDGTIFHRVIPEFMIQGGDPEGTGMGGPGYAFDDEFDPGLKFDRPGRLAMANSGPNSNGSQFFITEQAGDFLNDHYTLFGQCDDASVEVVKAIARVQRDANDKPLTPVVLEKVTIVPEGKPLPPLPAAPRPALQSPGSTTN
jgi:peptidyl-prolyl cis-trans isomerase A (cyclophilin A)